MKTLYSLIGLFSILAMPLSHACPDILEEVINSFNQRFEIAQEIEIERQSSLTFLMQPLENDLRNLRHIPEVADLLDQANAQFWDDLTQHQHNQILSIVSREANFQVDRSIPYFEMKSDLNIVPVEDFTFRGQQFFHNIPATINLRDFLNPRIEYGSSLPEIIENAHLVELHFRGQSNAQQLNREILTFFNKIIPSVTQERYILTPSSSHQHAIGLIPRRFFNSLKQQGYSDNDIASAMSFYLQNNETLMMLYYGMNRRLPSTRYLLERTEQPPLFDFLHSQDIQVMHEYFLEILQGENPRLGSRLKKNNIGIRSYETYDRNDVWGAEFRYLSFRYTLSDLRPLNLFNAVRRNMQTQNFPLHMPLLERIGQQQQRSLIDIGINSWWNVSSRDLITTWQDSPYTGLIIDIVNKYKVLLERNSSLENDHTEIVNGIDHLAALKMLLYRWDQHPYVADSPLLSDVITLQRRLIPELHQNPASIEFLIENFSHFIQRSQLIYIFESFLL